MEYKKVSHSQGSILLNKNGSHYKLLENMHNDYAIFQCVETSSFVVAWGTRTREDGIIEWASGSYYGENKEGAYLRFADRAYGIHVLDTADETVRIIQERTPFGLFILRPEKPGPCVGIDNTDGDTLTKEAASLELLFQLLIGEIGVNELQSGTR